MLTLCRMGMLTVLCLLCPLLAQAGQRDPFWPVGYQPPVPAPPLPPPVLEEAVAEAPEPAVEAAPKQEDKLACVQAGLHVCGIARRGNTYIATINGRQVRAGAQIEVMLDGTKYIFLVRSISLDRVTIEPAE